MEGSQVMSNLPTGTLTVLHTDIENSTPLTRHLREQYPVVLATHQTLLRAAFTAYEGWEVNTQGDSFFVVFPRATQAVAAAVQIQRTLATEPWPPGGVVRVRIGMHTGEPIRTTEGYTGLDVIRAARIKEAGHGGQVLLSASTAAIVQDALLDELGLRDLGAHRLKGLLRPERLFQLIIPGLPETFPPLQTLDSHMAPGSGAEGARVLHSHLRAKGQRLAWIPESSDPDVRAQRQQLAVPAGIRVRLLIRLTAPTFGRPCRQPCWRDSTRDAAGPTPISSILVPERGHDNCSETSSISIIHAYRAAVWQSRHNIPPFSRPCFNSNRSKQCKTKISTFHRI
jgi:class 3 adenylate cyclase